MLVQVERALSEQRAKCDAEIARAIASARSVRFATQRWNERHILFVANSRSMRCEQSATRRIDRRAPTPTPSSLAAKRLAYCCSLAHLSVVLLRSDI